MEKLMKKKDFVPKESNDVKELQNHLSLFGYLNKFNLGFNPRNEVPPELNGGEVYPEEPIMPEVGKMDDVTIEALKSYQEFHGLESTGELDKRTLAELDKKRCAMADVGEFSTHGNRWDTTKLTYGFTNYTSDNNLTKTSIHQAIAQAFALWAAETPLSFKRVRMSSNPDIKIEFAINDHGDISPFDGASGVLAHAFYPPPNSGDLAGDTHFDEAESWTINIPTGINKFDLVTVAAHEFGHSLGLRHSSVSSSLMFPSYGGAIRKLHADDKSGIRSIYGRYKIANASWVHGTDINIEYPDRLERITRSGFYTHLYGKPNTKNWFHFAIPTPVIMDNKRLKIVCAILRFRTISSNAIVKHIHIYDGYSKIASHNNIDLTGNNWFAKYGVAHKPKIYWGLGISIGVEFRGGSSGQRRMDFVSAGCDLMK